MVVNNDFKKTSFDLVILNKADLDRIMELQDIVYEDLEEKKLCVTLSEEEYLDALGDKGTIIGINDNEKLVGIYVALFPGQDIENLGREFDLETEELEKVCHLELAFVHPEYRGFKLHYKLGLNLINYVQLHRFTRYFCATVEPNNLPSLKNLFSFGLSIVKFSEMYGGLKRFILSLDISRLNLWDMSRAIMVESSDIERQKSLLNANWYGVEMKRDSCKTYIVYCKEKPRIC